MTDKEFSQLLIEAFGAFDDRTLARAIGMSTPSLQRWKAGRNFPHPAMRPRVKQVIEDMLLVKRVIEREKL